jgi:phosphoribosylformimino-5-aminoimidazole carboxamide ribotide isomerase
MIIYPAIDLIGGRPVRLSQGDYGSSEQVANTAWDAAAGFANACVEWVHMVDLDGAKAGHPVNFDIVRRVKDDTELKIELGGGIRTELDIEKALDAGANRVILGSVAINNPEFVQKAVGLYGEQIAVGIDAKDGYARGGGWLEGSNVYFIDLAAAMCGVGVRTIIFTDISRDGMLSGPNLEQLSELSSKVSADIIASGGIKDINDIRELSKLNLAGAICGKSIYKGTLDLKEAISVAG